MGISFTGTFTKFSLKSPSPITSTPPVDPGAGTPDGFFYASLNDTNLPQTGTANAVVTGTPTFIAAPNALNAGGLKVLNLKRNTDKVTYNGDFSALAGDFTMQFWINVVSNGGASGENVFFFGGGASGVRFYMRANMTVGNSQGGFDVTYRDKDNNFRTLNLVLDVGQWNHVAISKKGQVMAYVKNGAGGADTLTRSNGSTAVTGSTQTAANVVAPLATAFNGTSLALGGVAVRLADVQLQNTSIMPMTFMQNFVFTPFHADKFL